MNRPVFALVAFIALSCCAGVAGAEDGKAVYAKNCAACHAKGLVGAPKLGDKPAWAPRIAKGEEALVASVVAGKGVMQPRAGTPTLSDEDIKAAVEYMVSQAS